MSPMTDAEITRCNKVALRLAAEISYELLLVPLSPQQMLHALAIATSMIVSYESMQGYLEVLALSADAKEHAREIAAGISMDLN